MSRTKFEIVLDAFLVAEKQVRANPGPTTEAAYGAAKHGVWVAMKEGGDVIRAYADGLSDGGRAATNFLYIDGRRKCRNC